MKVKTYLISEFNQNSFDEEMLKYLMKYSKEKLEKKYDNHMQNLSSAYENFQFLKKNKNKNKEKESNYLTNFEYHCSATFEYAIHNCEKDEKVFGKFIKVIDKSNNKNLVKYVICERCRKSYFIEHFQNYCEKCEVSYYSCETSEDKKDLLIATLKTPHCEPVINEKMYCQFCKDLLYINVKTNQIKCTKCRFIANSRNMDWICNICSTKFKSDIIAYNKSEVNYIKKVINYGLLLKKLARPIKLPCCKNVDVKKVSFYHKKDCKGIIYFAEFHKKLIIICEKCKAVNNFGRFIWTCPKCSMRFKDMKWQENEIKLRKEIFIKKDIKINIDLNNDEFIEDRKNIRQLEDKDNINTIEIRTRSKNKSIYEILKKKTNFLPDKKTLENNNLVPKKNYKENKEVSTEGSDSKNNHYQVEVFSDNSTPDLIKVKRNTDSLDESNKNINVNKNKNEQINQKFKDKLPSGRQNFKKRYIFEKLVRRQFVSANNIMINKKMVAGDKLDNDIQENLQINEEIRKINEEREKEKIESDGKILNDIKKNFLQKMRYSQSNSDVKAIPRENRVKKANKKDLEDSNSQYLNKKENDNQIIYEVLLTEQKSLDQNFKKNIISSKASEKQINSNKLKKKESKNGIIRSLLKENENVKKKKKKVKIKKKF
jgi:hypothetical protein